MFNFDYEGLAEDILEKITSMIEDDENPKFKTTKNQKVAVVLKHLRPLRSRIDQYEAQIHPGVIS